MKRFTKTKEDFICAQCGTKVVGNGYTNHCSQCLWSKHVDCNPGDRASLCGGMMEPVSVLLKAVEWIIFHRCVSCGFRRAQRSKVDDNPGALKELSLCPISIAPRKKRK